jgi:adenine-specific DNA-methyltransferase
MKKTNIQKLELNWIGKGNDFRIEPRILIEDPDHSYGSEHSDNIIIYGDNLIALKSLEQDYTNKIKCIYIDPPYNSGNAFEQYEDNLAHSTWLNLMKPRLEILRNLLRNDGIIFISIDDDEFAYLKVLCDEIFNRGNFIGCFIWEKKKKPSFLSNMGIVTEYIVCYAKNKSSSPPFIFGETTRGKKYPINNAGNGIATLTFSIKSVRFNIPDQTIVPQNMSEGKIITKLLDRVVIKDGYNLAEFRLEGEWRYSQNKLNEIIDAGEEILISKIPFRPNHIKEGGEPKKMKNLLSVSHYGISTYEDATAESISLFGQNSFPYPKPEKLLYTLINSVTEDGDWVLDSFLGSGTTAAVAHKMNRKWIGIELGEHCHTHCIPRLKKVCDGTDQGGISESVDWKGGGGFKYYYLAPSLLKQDKYGNWIIEEKYNANMLAAAMAKHNNFKYQPSEDVYWKQGQSSEKDFIYTTTQFITVEKLDQIHEEMQPDESLLICCKKFSKPCENRYENITIKKIPQMLLGKCEFGREDYSLNIISMPRNENESEFVPKGPDKKKNTKEDSNSPDLFSENNGEEL